MVSDKMKHSTIKYTSLALVVIQSTSLVLFMKFAMTGDRPKFIKALAVFYGEIIKFVASIFLCCFSHGSISGGLKELYTECVHKKKDFAKVLIPAIVYTVQNIILYIAVDNLSATTYLVTYQLKILTTALFTVLVLKRRLSVQQWIALFILFAGVVVVQYDEKLSNDREKMAHFSNASVVQSFNTTEASTQVNATKETNPIVGFIAVLAACVMSGFAGIYFEKILKGSPVSVWARNVQLAGPSIIFSLLFAFAIDHKLIFANGYDLAAVGSNMIQGFDWAVWTTVFISAIGGLIVAVVIKFADNILKAFATSFAIILNCIIAYFLFTFRPSVLFAVGTILVLGAVFGYSIPCRSIIQLNKGGKEAKKGIKMGDVKDIEGIAVHKV